mmetsp:Transcript_39185/g.112692  ORF Transcript_39185/g.112692 Transcript_39185/m.112692 type:complete len:412 (+) Transcript_39185:1-1236(+)
MRNASEETARFSRFLRTARRSLPGLEVHDLAYPPGAPGCTLRWRPMRQAVAIFMHIGKAGGTAFRSAIVGRPMEHDREVFFLPSSNLDIGPPSTDFVTGRLKWRYTKGNKHEYGDGQLWEYHLPELLSRSAMRSRDLEVPLVGSPGLRGIPCLCTEHFDFSLMRPLFHVLPEGSVLAVAIMRDPVKRFLSHFYYARGLRWTEGLRIREVSPLEFLHQPSSLLDALMVWQDGLAGVSWFAGETVHYGMGATGDSADNARMRMTIRNRTETLRRAVRNYHKFVFVGLLEEKSASMELLQHAMGWATPPQMERLNAASPAYPEPTRGEMGRIRAALRALIPMDLWFYEYVRADFRSRVAALRAAQHDGGQRFKRCRQRWAGGAVPSVKVPSEEELGGCVATRQALACGSHVFAK